MILGLTGGICSGKNLVSTFLKEKGCVIFDADIIAEKLCQKEKICWKKIINIFGQDILDKKKEIDRKKLAGIVFNNKNKLDLLESIVHPYVKDEIKKKIDSIDKKIFIVINAPLLLEAKFEDMVSKIILVSCDKKKQIERCRKRDNLTEQEIEKRIENQMCLQEKIKKADFIIDNNKTIKQTRRQFETIWQKLTEI